MRYADDRAGGDTKARRVLRGGSWINDARNCRSAQRNANDPDNRIDNNGFRLARALRVHRSEEPQEAQSQVRSTRIVGCAWRSVAAPVRQ